MTDFCPRVIEAKEFACIAEAVAEYYKRGFETVEGASTDGRIMHNDASQEVYIRKRGFLDVVATVINL